MAGVKIAYDYHGHAYSVIAWTAEVACTVPDLRTDHSQAACEAQIAKVNARVEQMAGLYREALSSGLRATIADNSSFEVLADGAGTGRRSGAGQGERTVAGRQPCGNPTRLCLDLGITAWISWLVGPAVDLSVVDLSVVGLLTGMRYLSLHGYTDVQLSKLRRMLRFCGLLTLALSTSGALSHRTFGTALVDAVGPALLIGRSEVGPWMLRQIYAVCAPTSATQFRPMGACALAVSPC
jgi:hypothetical protein